MFGDHLMEKKRYEEAGLVFMKAESWPSALQAFEKCLNWRQALCVAAILDYSAENRYDLSLRLASMFPFENHVHLYFIFSSDKAVK